MLYYIDCILTHLRVKIQSEALLFSPDGPIVLLFCEGLAAVNGSVADLQALGQHVCNLCLVNLDSGTDILFHNLVSYSP